MTNNDNNALIEAHISYAHAIGAELLSRFPPHINRQDVTAAAEFGLVQAAAAFNPNRGVAFTTFAYYRVRGAIFDLLRQSVKASRFEQAANEFMLDQTAAPDAGSSSNNPYEDAKSLATNIVATYFLSLENLPQEPEDNAAGPSAPLDTLIRAEQQQAVRAALAALPEKNRQVLHAYYFEELTLEQIGARLGLSKSWVSRMHAKGIELLRPAIEKSLSSSSASSKSHGQHP